METIKIASEKLENRKVNQYNFAKQSVLPGFQEKSIARIARNHCGLHSARLPSPYVALHSRLMNYKTEMLWDNLYNHRNLIKLRCMRKTLHIVPFDLAPIVHTATLQLRLNDCLKFYKHNKIDTILIENIKHTIIDFTQNEPRSTIDLLTQVKRTVAVNDSAILQDNLSRMVIKELWERGTLCYINRSNEWDKESRVYGLTSSFYPDLQLNGMGVKEAQKRLFLYYIENFGPVSIKDMSWWSGLSGRIVRDSIDLIKEKLIALNFEDNDLVVLMTIEDYEKYLSFNENEAEWIRLLAYEDPSLKGYFETRFRYVNLQYYEQLFNQIGEVRASIILNGKVVGTWDWNKKERNIEFTFFEELQSRYHDMLQEDTYSMISCLNNGPVQYKLIDDN